MNISLGLANRMIRNRQRIFVHRPVDDPLLHDAIAIEELLRGAERCLVKLFGTLDQTKARPKLRVQRLGVVANYLEPTALHRTLQPESADDHMSPGFTARAARRI
jgi:hypothetical protein